MSLLAKLEKELIEGPFPEKEKKLFHIFCQSYEKAVRNLPESEFYLSILFTFLERLKEQMKEPYVFEPYHKKVQSPFDYYQFGLDFIRPLIDFSTSTINGKDELRLIEEKISRGENVIFLANHQIEADPQVLSLLLEKNYPVLAKEMISVAGERVIIDPLAAPFSRGRNLLCIYSKRYIDNPPALKEQKQLHNKKTMQLMSELLSEGGHSIYVAPSGGRDRRDELGIIQVAPFDPQSIELFYLMTKKASKPTTFYPMALSTYHLLPPPKTIQKEIGEIREVSRGPVHLWIGSAINMEQLPLAEEDKRKKRELRAEFIWNEVKKAYHQFP